jgi:hypothetical protein
MSGNIAEKVGRFRNHQQHQTIKAGRGWHHHSRGVIPWLIALSRERLLTIWRLSYNFPIETPPRFAEELDERVARIGQLSDAELMRIAIGGRGA